MKKKNHKKENKNKQTKSKKTQNNKKAKKNPKKTAHFLNTTVGICIKKPMVNSVIYLLFIGSLTDEGHSRNASWALNVICTFLLYWCHMLFSYQTGYIMWHSSDNIYPKPEISHLYTMSDQNQKTGTPNN